MKTYKGTIWMDGVEGDSVGTAEFTEEEARHFECAPRVVARAALSDEDLTRLGIREDDYIIINVSVND